MLKERLALAVEHGPFARKTVQEIAEVAELLAQQHTVEAAEELIRLIKVLTQTAQGERPL